MNVKFKQRKMVCFVAFIIFIGSCMSSQKIPVLEIRIDPYTKNFLKTYSQMVPHLMKSPREVEEELQKRYYEAWAADKSQWPECMRKVFENLKEFKVIPINFKIESPYRLPFYQGDMDADGRFRGNFFDTWILNVYADKFHVTQNKIESLNLDKTRINPNMWFDTSGVFLHELIHMALRRNEWVDKEYKVYDNGQVVDSWQDDTRPEDCTTKAIKNAVRYYDLKGKNPEKNVADDCDCKNKSTKNATTSGAGGSSNYSPGNDHGDECFSFAQGRNFEHTIFFDTYNFSCKIFSLKNPPQNTTFGVLQILLKRGKMMEFIGKICLGGFECR